MRKNVGHVISSGAWLIQRIGRSKLPLEQDAGQPFDLIAWMKQVSPDPPAMPREGAVWLTTPRGRFALRLIAWAIPQQATEEARRRLRKASAKQGRTVDECSLLAAGFVIVVTNLPEPGRQAE